MSRITSDEQFQFLISCIRFSNGGKVDFAEVAKECNIVTKGAAAKRYERLMKTHGINPNGGGPASPATPSTTATTTGDTDSPSKPKTTKAKTGTKRKAPATTAKGSGPKRAKMKNAIVDIAEKLVGQNGDQHIKEEDVGSGVDTETEDVGGNEALFNRFCNADGTAGDDALVKNEDDA
ncbi:hypothetical protein MW887_010051 [Aspergillus wentii]|nr:hypothetical protein MW887_010051 [Aspergillus wentii]